MVLSLCSRASATSLRSIGPIAEIDQLSVDTMRGDSLGLASDRGKPVFGTDFARVERLEAEMKAIATEQFKAGGVQVLDGSENVVILKLFGGTFRGSGNESSVFFMLQVDVCLAQEVRCSPERAVLGVAGDSQVENSVLEAVLEVTKDFVEKRSAYRAKTHSK